MGLESSPYDITPIIIKDARENIKEPLLPVSEKSMNSADASPDQGSKRGAIIDLLRKFAGETMASFLVVFTCCAVATNTQGAGSASTLATSIIGGVAVMVAIFSIGHVSGAHINPAVTVAQTAINHFPLRLAPMYLSAHLVGGTLASLAVELLCAPDDGFLLIGEFAGMAVGSAIAIDLIVIGPVSGGGVNPARALGPAFASWTFDENLWVFVLGPCAGGVLGALLYRLLRKGDSITKFKYQKATDAIFSASAGKRLRQLTLNPNASSA